MPVRAHPCPVPVCPLWTVGCVVTTDSCPPVVAALVAIAQDLRRNPQVVIGVQCPLRTPEPLLVIPPVHLHQPDVDRCPALVEQVLQGRFRLPP